MNQSRNSIPADGFNDKSFPSTGDGHVEVPATFKNGKYRVEYWNTYKGKVIDTEKINISGWSRRIPIISHRVDLAIKVRPVD